MSTKITKTQTTTLIIELELTEEMRTRLDDQLTDMIDLVSIEMGECDTVDLLRDIYHEL